jgi:NADPH:quinone reductase-like Zn-dependent oxidoreductase
MNAKANVGKRVRAMVENNSAKRKGATAAMKAIVQDRYGSADVLELRDIEKPTAGDDDVLVRVHAAGVDPGVWHLMTGRPYLVRAMGFGFRKPKFRIRGSDAAGIVEAAGKNVIQLKQGDQVYGTCDGSFAEYACAKAERFAPKPSNLSFEQAAAVPVSGMTALNGLRDAGKLQPEQKVLIIGAAGGVGTYAVQLAKAFGAVVTGVCSTSKADLVRAIGADEVIDYTRADFTDGARQFDLILDTAGRRPLSQLRRALTPQGTLVIVGGEGGDRWLGGFQRQIFAPLRSRFTEQKLLGLISKERQQDLLTLKDLIEAGKLTPVIDRTYPLSEAPQAIRYLEQGLARGKVVLTVPK